jgi:hypothetical protein
VVADQIVVCATQVEECADVAGEQFRALHQAIERLQRVTSVVGMHAQALSGGDQQLRDRIVERPFGELECCIRTGPGLPGGVMGDQPANDRQPGPRMRRQIGLAETVGCFRRTTRQGNRHNQRCRVRPVAQAEFRLQSSDAVVVRDLPRQSRLLAGRRAARVVAPCGGRRLIGDDGQRPRGQAAAVPLHREAAAARQLPLRLKAGLIQRGKGTGAVVQRQCRCDAATRDIHRQMRTGGNRDRAALGLQKDRRDAGVGRRRDPGLEFGRRGTLRHRQ